MKKSERRCPICEDIVYLECYYEKPDGKYWVKYLRCPECKKTMQEKLLNADR